MNFTINDISEIRQVAKKIIDNIGNKRIVAFYGEMGAGKTTLIKAICEELGVVDNISSPTFSIVNEYKTQKGERIFHFDFYRIKSQTEAFDMGYEDYFYSNAYCFIEWPEKILELLPTEIVNVSIKIHDEKRILEIF